MILSGSCSTYRVIPYVLFLVLQFPGDDNGFCVPHLLISRSLYFESFSTSFAATFLSYGTALSIRMHCFFFPLSMISGLFALMSLSV